MPDYLSPGVYIEEVSGAQPIEGVSTSVTGFVGVTQMGPLDGLGPVLVTSFPEFERTFGSYFTPGYAGAGYNFLPHAVAGFFNNGGQLLYIKRVASAASPPAVAGAASGLANNAGTPALMTRLVATGSNGATGATSVRLQSLLGLEVNTTMVLTQQKNGISTASGTLTVSSYDGSTNTVWFSPALAASFDPNYTTVALSSATAVTASGAPANAAGSPLAPVANAANFVLNAADPGIWGNTVPGTPPSGLLVQITPSSRAQAQVQSVSSVSGGTNNLVSMNSGANFYAGAILEFDTGGTFSVTGGVTSGTFTAGEALVQSTTNAKAILVGTVTGANPMTIRSLTGTPSAGDTWVGQTSSAVYTPTAVPAVVFAGKFYAKVQTVQGSGLLLVNGLTTAQLAAVQANTSATPAVAVWARTCEFDIVASYGTVNETFKGLTLDSTTPYFYGTTIINGSNLLSVPQSPSIPSDNTTTNPSTMPTAADGLNGVMAGGTDGSAPTSGDFVGMDLGPGKRTGIAALIDAQNISIIAAPGSTDQDTQNALITQCENLMYRFAILDPAPSASGGTPSMTDIQNQRDLYDTKYAAIYYPRLVVTDPLTEMPLTIPPSGHVAGIYAQTDNTRGVWKAPANVVINGINSLEIKLSKGDQDILNPEPNNINALRDFTAQGRGLRVYGARCITSLTEWKYVNVRRLFIFLEASLDQGLQWAVFEPNDQRLWNQLIQSVSAFLTSIWRQGGLMGAKAEEAFFVKCGYDTMSQDDIDNGRLIMLVGVAPVFPAEFVIVRIGQWAGGSSVQEL